jgi:hypothetical protein
MITNLKGNILCFGGSTYFRYNNPMEEVQIETISSSDLDLDSEKREVNKDQLCSNKKCNTIY